MKEQTYSLLERAIKEKPEVLMPVLQASYSLRKKSKLEVLEIARNVNKQLGYELFDDLYYTRLIHDFSFVTRVFAQVAISKP